ncbi:MAG: M16 family metallopeptidase [Rhodospirillaceae bacterium]
MTNDAALIHSIGSVRVSRLANGLRVATDSIPQVESVTLGIWVGVGTRHEPVRINGVSHLLEHMAFKGTRRRDATAIAEEIEAVGGHLNAYTSRECTAYYARVLKEDIGVGLDILSDILQHSVFDGEELNREREVVVQEILQSLDTPDDIIFDRFQQVAYPDQAIGRPVLGTTDSVRSMTSDVVGGYLRGTYAPDRMVVAASGNLDHDRFVAAVAEAFDSLPVPAAPSTDPGLYRGGEFREERSLEQVHVVLGFNSLSHLDRDYYAASVFSILHGGGMSSRLFQEVREKRGLAYSVYSFINAYDDTGLYGIYAGTGREDVPDLIDLLCAETKGLADAAPTMAEVDRAKAQLRAGLLMGLESTSGRCEQLARNLLTHGRPLTTAELTAEVDAVTPEKCQEIAKAMLSSDPTLAVIGPLDGVPGVDRVRERLGSN